MIQKKKDYKQEYLEDFIGLTGITDLTLQDVYGAMVLMVRHGYLDQKAKSLWSRYQFNHLYQRMLDYDDFYNQTIPMFKQAVEQTRYDRAHRRKKEREALKDYTTPINNTSDDDDYTTPEEDMDTVSRELLKQDDVFYEQHSDEYVERLFETAGLNDVFKDALLS